MARTIKESNKAHFEALQVVENFKANGGKVNELGITRSKIKKMKANKPSSTKKTPLKGAE